MLKKTLDHFDLILQISLHKSWYGSKVLQYSAVLYCIVLYSTVGGGWCSHEMVRGWAGDSQQLSPDTATLLQLAVSRPMSWPQVSLRSASPPDTAHLVTGLKWSCPCPQSSDSFTHSFKENSRATSVIDIWITSHLYSPYRAMSSSTIQQ